MCLHLHILLPALGPQVVVVKHRVDLYDVGRMVPDKGHLPGRKGQLVKVSSFHEVVLLVWLAFWNDA